MLSTLTPLLIVAGIALALAVGIGIAMLLRSTN